MLLPYVACQSNCHSRQAYWPLSLPSLAGFQVLPPSTETSTRATGEVLDQAVPLMRTRPGLIQPASGVAITDFTLRSVTGIISLGSTAGAGRDRMLGMAVSRLHPEAFEFVIQHFDVPQPFHPGIAGPAGSNQAQWRTVLEGQCFPVHFISEQRIGMEGFLLRDGALKLGHLAERDIGAIEKNVLGGIFQAGLFQNIAKTDAASSERCPRRRTPTAFPIRAADRSCGRCRRIPPPPPFPRGAFF